MGMISVSCTVCMVDDVGDVSITIWDNVLGKIPRNVGPVVCLFVCFFLMFLRLRAREKEKRKYFFFYRKYREK